MNNQIEYEQINEQKKEKYNSTDSVNAFAGGIIAPIIASFILTFILTIVASYMKEELDVLLQYQPLLLFTMLITPLAFIWFMWWYNRKHNINFVKANNYKKVNVWLLLLCIAVGIAFLYLTSGLIGLLDETLLRNIGYSKSSSLAFNIDSIGTLIVALLAVAVVPAFVEETLFRGMVLGGLINKKASLGKKCCAVVLSAVIFALIHCSAQQFIFPFICGLLFGFVYLFTGNIWYSIAMHFASNAVVVVSMYLQNINEITATATITSDFNYWMICIALFLVAVALVIGLLFVIKKVNKKSSAFMENEFEVEVLEPNTTLINEDADDEMLEQNPNIEITYGIQSENKSCLIKEKPARYKFFILLAFSILILIMDFVTYLLVE